MQGWRVGKRVHWQVLFEPYPEIIAAYLYGSQAQGVAHDRSDVDVAVLLDSAKLPKDSLLYQFELAARLERTIRKQVDLILLHEAPPLLTFQVLKARKILYERDAERRSQFERAALARYYDFRDYFDLHRSALQAHFLGEPSVIDRAVIERRLTTLEHYVNGLRRYQHLRLADYREDFEIRMTTERLLQLSIQICMDIASYIIARKRLKVPDTAADVFHVLAGARIVPRAFADRVTHMVGCRNRLVHGYLDIDPAQVHQVLQTRLKDFESFIRHVLRWLEQDKGKPDRNPR